MGAALIERGVSMKVIGLTGGIASGKSTVSMLLKQKGAVIIDADNIARQILEPNKPAWVEVIKHFGREILQNNNEIDRKKLANIVFSDKGQLEVLNSITHPIIINEIKKRIESYSKTNKVVVVDAALILELGLDRLVDEVWVIAIDEKTQLKRLLEREKNMSRQEALARIRSQMPQTEKIKLADRVLDNNGSLDDIKNQIEILWREIIKE